MEWSDSGRFPVEARRTLRAGSASYSWARRAALAFDAIVSFSAAPMKAVLLAGVGVAAIAMLGALSLMG